MIFKYGLFCCDVLYSHIYVYLYLMYMCMPLAVSSLIKETSGVLV